MNHDLIINYIYFDLCDKNKSIAYLDATNMLWRNVNFSGKNFVGCNFRCNQFERVKIIGASFEKCVFDNSTFNNVWIENSKFLDCSFVDITFKCRVLATSKFIRCNVDEKVRREMQTHSSVQIVN